MVKDLRAFYIDGQWVAPTGSVTLEVVDPSTEKAIATIAVAEEEDVDRAVKAAQRAFPAFSATGIEERKRLLRAILDRYQAHYEEFAQAISAEMGAPITFAREIHAATAVLHLQILLEKLESFDFSVEHGNSRIVKEAAGVCALITPWNFPVHQVMSKVAPAIAAGCTLLLKPSELSPVSTHLLARVMEEAGVPPGVFNLLNGDGARTGHLLAAHPGIDMISFTGSTRGGIAVAQAAAAHVTRTTLELGGKSANIVADDDAFPNHVIAAVQGLMMNSGQNCMAPSRLLVPAARINEAAAIAAAAARAIRSGPAADPETQLGPVVSRRQWAMIQGYIARGVEEGATLVCGGPGLPEGLTCGYHVRPTIFSHVTNRMAIAREEIFGPVLSILGYASIEEAVSIANDSPYGLAAYVQAADQQEARRIARGLRVGSVFINNPPFDLSAPIGGFKMSGYGREWGVFGLEEFLATRALLGYHAAE